MKVLGLKKHKDSNKTYWRNDWMSFYPGFFKLNFKISPAGYFDNRANIIFSLGWGQFFIHIPFITSKYDECEPPRYGFYFYATEKWWPDCFVICKGKKTKHIDLPWAYEWIRTSKLLKDDTWAHSTKKSRKDFYKNEWQEKLWSESYSYIYTLKDGTIQERIATIKVEEREWRQKWIKWTKLFSMIRKYIDIEFSDEIGERTGSWKGGTVGCSYNMLPNETPLECLRRMEKERKF
jgi:hypothetical protein